MEKTLNIAFFGTPAFATLVLKELAAAGYIPSVIVTAPDKPAGRGLVLTSSPIKQYALDHSIDVLQPEKITDEFIEEMRAKKLDLIIVAAYGKILPMSLLSLPKYSSLNVHPSLLPKYRGTSPVESQILNDEHHVGVSIIEMDAQMDHGPIIAQQEIALPHWPVYREELNTLLWRAGGKLLGESLRGWVAHTVQGKPQDHAAATFTKKITKEDGLLDFTVSGYTNYLKYLAYYGWPGSYFFKEGKRIKITKAHFDGEHFLVDEVIPENGKRVAYDAWIART